MKRANSNTKKKQASFSIYFSEPDDKLLCDVVATVEGMLPGTAGRHLLMRGMAAYLADGQLASSQWSEQKVLDEIRRRVKNLPEYQQALKIVQDKQRAKNARSGKIPDAAIIGKRGPVGSGAKG